MLLLLKCKKCKIMKFKFFFIIASLVIISCKRELNKSDDGNSIVIDASTEACITVTEFVDSVDFIKLETTEQCLIGRISKILFVNDLLIIQDSKTHTIFLFDKNGKFRHSISKRGNGPGEYINLTRVMYDFDKNQIIVYDGTSKKIFFYNMYGDLIKEINQFSEGNPIRDVINLPNGNFLCYCHDYSDGFTYSGLWEVDSTGSFLKTHLDKKEGYPFFLNEDQAYLYPISDRVIGLCCGDADEIYHYQQDSLYKYLSYNIKNGTSIENIKNSRKEEKEKFVRKNKTHEKGNFLLTEWIDDKNIGFFSIYSKKDSKVTMGRVFDFNNTPFASVFGRIIDSNDTNSIVIAITADLVLEDLTSKYTSDVARNKLKELTMAMSENEITEMNPIIEILYLKQ